MAKIVFIFLMLLFFFSNSEGEGGQLIMIKAPDVALHDQYGTLLTLRQLEGHLVILIASNMDGLDHNRRWGRAIREKYHDRVYILGVADTRGIPSMMEKVVKKFFRDEEISVLLDWKGYVFDTNGLSIGISNIVLIDRQGFIRYIYAGDASKKAIDALFHEVDALVSQGKEEPY